jgi:DNA-binding NarL/FixJ family response regulator
MPKIKCLLVDDHTLFRQGVRRLLESESDFEVTGESPDGGDAVEKARELRPDIVLMDIGMPGLSSFESARQIKKMRPETKILFLTMYEDEDYLVQCLEVGASGYVLKDTPAPQLLSAVRDVYKGRCSESWWRTSEAGCAIPGCVRAFPRSRPARGRS